ncbi:hypothetical protein PC118_g18969 [Phytophthora cactorum]|uniref:Uncharacterized protein n=1 Tax=Phytophthora cactorum TaxID=29920 RepID=A0A8T1F7C8_9STRA|nr:hypothetical protein PC115_g18844 [Phytophthora cactorum]KAG2966777.1 hypothetical protein PC118_g18969 [Phytophthora cactorum]
MLGGFGRSDVPHSGNTTNNRLEAAWGLLFDPQHKGKRLDACEDILKELFPDQVAKMTIKLWVVSRSRRLFQRSNENNSKYSVPDYLHHLFVAALMSLFSDILIDMTATTTSFTRNHSR